MKLTQKDLVNMAEMAYKGKGNIPIKYKRIDENRDIEITCSFEPQFIPKEDIYPYYKLEMKEEELKTSYFFATTEIPTIVEIWNKFISQGVGESYLQNNMLPY